MKEVVVRISEDEIVIVGRVRRKCRYCRGRGTETVLILGRRKKIPCRCLLDIRVEQ